MALTRKPLQQRSRKRVKLIKDTAREIILDKGSAAFTMLEVAKRADITVASIYQYFANQTDLITALAGEVYEESMQQIVPQAIESLVSMSFEEGLDFLDNALDQYCLISAEDPVRMEIFIAMESDKKLKEFKWELALRSSHTLFTIFAQHFPESEHAWLKRLANYYSYGLHNTLRMIGLVDKSEVQQYIDNVKYSMTAPLKLKRLELLQKA